MFRRSITVIAALSLASCASRDSMEAVADTGEVEWELVSTDPPVLFPKGLPHDYPTSRGSGEWMDAGVDGVRFFVPIKGAGGHSYTTLRNDAFGRSSKKMQHTYFYDKVRVEGLRNLAKITNISF